MFPTKLVVAILAFLFLSSEARKSAAEWKKIDLDAVELDLEFGDDEEFIPTDDQLAAQRLAAGDMSKAKEFNAHIQKRSPIEFSSHAQSLGGPAMMIVNLKKVDPTTKKRWRKDRLREVAFEWRSLLALNGIKADAYDIGSEDSAPTILLSTTEGYFGFEIRNFLLRRSEVLFVEWDQKKYYPKVLQDDGTAPSAHFGDMDFLGEGGDISNLEGMLPPEVLESMKGGPNVKKSVSTGKKTEKKKGKKDKKKKMSSKSRKDEL